MDNCTRVSLWVAPTPLRSFTSVLGSWRWHVRNSGGKKLERLASLRSAAAIAAVTRDAILLCALFVFLWPTSARAEDPDALRKLVASQAAVIEALQQRVSALEAHEQGEERAAPSQPTATPPPSHPAPSSEVAVTGHAAAPITIDWSEGSPNFELANGSSFHVRGRLYLDASTTSGSRFSSRDISGTELSSARLGVDGRYGEHWNYKVELEFADGGTTLKENYVGYAGKLGSNDLKIYAGNKTGDRSIDGASYDDYVPFFQRSMLATSVGPEKGIFGVGVLAQLIGRDWHVGLDLVGDDANGNVGTADDTLTYVGRATWTPGLDRLTRVHIGGWGYYEDISKGNSTIARSIYPGEHFDDDLRITMVPVANARSTTGEGGEVGVMRGSFWTFGEYGRRSISALSGDRTWTSKVAEAGFFLTGEKPNFSSRTGVWTQVAPRRSFFDGGPGAIEIAARYETADLGRSELAGSGSDMTFAVDWFLTRNVRAIADLVHWKVTNPIAPYVGRDTGNTINLRLDTSF